jgi:hypothetical protein
MPHTKLSGILDVRIATYGDYPVKVRKGTLPGEVTITIPPRQPAFIYLNELNRWLIPVEPEQRVYDLLTADATLFRVSPGIS